VTYLREVHYYAYYSGCEYVEDPTSMVPAELRPSFIKLTNSSAAAEANERWVKKVDSCSNEILGRVRDRPRSKADDGFDLRKERLNEWLEANTKQEGPGRFRCLLPPLKLFKGKEYLQKHIRNKHPEKVQEVLAKADEEQYRINHANDPGKMEIATVFTQGLLGGYGQNVDGKRGAGNSRGGHDGRFSHGIQNGGVGMSSNIYSGANGGDSLGGHGMPPVMQMGMLSAAGLSRHAIPVMMMSNSFPGTGMASSSFNSGVRGGGFVSNRGGRGGARGGRGGRGGNFRGGGFGGVGGRGGRGQNPHHHAPLPSHKQQQGRPLDPRARGKQRNYNDLDAPAAYDDI
jgi:hypothetical protein